MALGHRMVGLLGAGAAVFATSLAQAQCSMDTDCKGDRVCEDGSCVAAKAAGPAPAAVAPAPVAGQAEPAQAEAPSGAREENVAGEATDTKPAQPKMQRHSKGMMVGGIVMVSLAPVSLIIAGFAGLGKALCGVDDYDSQRTCSAYDPVIYGTLAGAFVLVGVGVPLLVIGAQKEPVDPADTTATISPWVTPKAGGLSLRLQM